MSSVPTDRNMANTTMQAGNDARDVVGHNRGRTSRTPPTEPENSTTTHTGSGDLTATFEIRYVSDLTGDRIATAQANAIHALLEWVAHRDAATDHTH